MTAILARGRARIAAVLTVTALAGAAAALVAGAASARPPVPLPTEPGAPTIVCAIPAPPNAPAVPGPPVHFERVEPLPTGPGPQVRIERARPLPPGVVVPDCPDLGEHGIVSVRPGDPVGPQVTIERGGPGEFGIAFAQPAQPARIAPTGSSGR
ncbi:hypothetical protein ACLMAJ_25135 [Nocardia sp. KC 131]|uniref:hypothetical protein n=1 Tax=Nocardia arseniciresistens TaxID=3392119 RepID=UPI00398F3DDB